MNEKNKNIILYSIAGIFSFTLFLMIINSIILRDYYSLFWYCYTAILLIIIGLLTKNAKLILSQVIILAIPDLFWIFDFFYLIFTGHSLLGLVKNFPNDSLFNKITNLQHLYIVPFSLLALSFLKIKKNYKVLLVGIGEIILIFLVTLFFIPASSIINCINVNCIDINLIFLPPYLLWFIFTFSFVIISYLIITSLPFIKKNNKN